MRLMVLKRFGAVVLCQLCAQSIYIADVEIDHHQALVDGGAHDWESNMRPVCKGCHALKSAREHKNNAKAKRLATKHSQPKAPGTIKSRGFQGSRKFNGIVTWKTK
jgi:5-methylcytosine-specific restriction endonuclease McrA